MHAWVCFYFERNLCKDCCLHISEVICFFWSEQQYYWCHLLFISKMKKQMTAEVFKIVSKILFTIWPKFCQKSNWLWLMSWKALRCNESKNYESCFTCFGCGIIQFSVVNPSDVSWCLTYLERWRSGNPSNIWSGNMENWCLHKFILTLSDL